MKKKIALITGVTGQDGSHLIDFLIKKNYLVIGTKRKSSTFNTARIDHIYDNKDYSKNYIDVYEDMTDSMSLLNVIKRFKPHEIYNLAAQSHVMTSFETPEYTANTNALGCLRILETIRILNLEKKTRFYQASTSEIFGNTEIPQNENTPFKPTSPYAIAKLYAFWTTVNYREAYNMFACNGILFNHEGERRGQTFVTRKISRFVAKRYHGSSEILKLGNINAKRDWGYAKDYVEAMWKMLQLQKPEDFVISTGKSKSVRQFIEESFKVIDIRIKWIGRGLKEKAIDPSNGNILVEIDPSYIRPSEIDELRGSYQKAKKILKWKPKTTFSQLVKHMVLDDIDKLENEKDNY